MVTMSNIINFTGHTVKDIPVEDVLEGAKSLISCIVIGEDTDGNLCVASSKGNLAEIIYLLELAKKYMLED